MILYRWMWHLPYPPETQRIINSADKVADRFRDLARLPAASTLL